jgi:hypothetical protein
MSAAKTGDFIHHILDAIVIDNPGIELSALPALAHAIFSTPRLPTFLDITRPGRICENNDFANMKRPLNPNRRKIYGVATRPPFKGVETPVVPGNVIGNPRTERTAR